MSVDEGALARYVYAVARPFDPAPLAGLTGVGGHPVEAVAHRGLLAVVSPVPLREFDEAALKAKLEDLGWLERVARAHHAVVDAVMPLAAAVPLRLATVYRGEERVRAALDEDRAVFERALDRLSGRLEFGVKIYADPGSRGEPEPAPAAPAGAEPGESPGRAYLRRRREQRRRRDDSWQVAAALVERVDAALREWADAMARHRPQDAALSKAPGENVLNAAYLVAEDDAEGFLRTAARLRDEAPEGTRVEVSGPWAPYSFAGLDRAGEPA
ncbi:GvpL/GvpF family gas vesicle protein [Allonocardiopsis opalescens]|uniref:Gas vesicle protein GvpL/GvpF n=1 Tax=Allonocardiopsis opalescens TaxID=1144618 RepID=A0A2T0QEL0_9ACTN|nr:GvpL/GvpF family gas vesicle protein [Allonocardiopsis opalescens]PRY02359.1 gas vesicle protein GvpL/GvpF [Allonocardiopsis opalescens]